MLADYRSECRSCLACLAWLALACSVALASPAWVDVAPLPGPRAFHMTAFTSTDSGARLYAIGGQRSPSDTMERLCMEYSPQTNSWRQLAAMRQRRGLGQACTVRGQVWVFGGCRTFGTGLSDVEAYDPAEDTWTIEPSMPESIYDFGAVVWRDSLVYVLGGGSWSPSMPPVNNVWLFDPAAGTWHIATPLPVPLGAMACGIVGDTIIVATGWTDSGPTNRTWIGPISLADPHIINWHEIHDTLPGPRRCRASCGVIGHKLFVIGGLELDPTMSFGLHPSSLSLLPSGFSGLHDVWSLAPTSGAWTERPDKPQNVSCVYGTGSDAASRIYVPGGYPGAAPYLRTADYLDMSSYTHDVGITAILSPEGRLVPEDTCPVAIEIRNFGTAAETPRARISILDSATGSPVFTGDSSLGLAADSSRVVEFGSFVPHGRTVFHATAFVSLSGDQNPGNDTMRARSRTTTGSDPDGFGYVYKSTQEPDNLAFSWFDPSGGTLINDWTPNGDEGTSRRTLPFRLDFYGNAINRIYVCTNGYLETSTSIAGLNFPFPYAGITNIIAPFWEDLSVRDTGEVYENLTADSAVYTWVDARRLPLDTGRLTFQVILHPGGDIRFNYLNITADATSSTIGIQGGDGSWNYYQQYVYDADPQKHVPTSSTSIFFDAPPLGIAEQQGFSLSPIGLHVPSICRGPVHITVSADVRSLQVFNVSGRLVRSLGAVSRQVSAVSSFTWDRRDQQGRLLPAGVYLLCAASGQRGLTRKLILLN